MAEAEQADEVGRGAGEARKTDEPVDDEQARLQGNQCKCAGERLLETKECRCTHDLAL